MGLDTSHNAWGGSYSNFNNFRRWLAEKAGINLDEYIGYNNEDATKDLTSINHKLMPLFNHSDCDGLLTPDECKQIADGIQEILNFEPEENPNTNSFNRFSNYNKAKKFREGCLLAYALDENIEFN